MLSMSATICPVALMLLRDLDLLASLRIKSGTTDSGILDFLPASFDNMYMSIRVESAIEARYDSFHPHSDAGFTALNTLQPLGSCDISLEARSGRTVAISSP